MQTIVAKFLSYILPIGALGILIYLLLAVLPNRIELLRSDATLTAVQQVIDQTHSAIIAN